MASDVHKNTDTKVETVSANSVCRQNTAEQGMAASDGFSMAVPSEYAASTWRMAGNGACTHSPAKA